MPKLEPMYFALDFETGPEALQFINENGMKGIPVKVGMELFFREGAAIIERLKMDGHSVFLDLKLHDIPVTVRRAMANLARVGVDVVNVHALGGGEMITAAHSGLCKGSPAGERPLLLAVTHLTSSNQTMLEEELLIDQPIDEVVGHYAQLAKKNGADGVVCSVEEIEKVKHTSGSSFKTLTPGIRLESSDIDDQKRVATPGQAGEKGSDSIVVGRPIRTSHDPLTTYQTIKEEFIHGQSTTDS